MAKGSKNLFINVMTSGKALDSRDEAAMDTLVRYVMLNFLIFLGGSILFIFAFNNYFAAQPILALFDFLMGTMTIVAFVVLRTEAPFVVSGLLTVIPFGTLCSFFAISGGAQGSGILWCFSFPMMAVFLLGMRLGALLSGVVGVVLTLCLFVPGFSGSEVNSAFAFRAFAIYLLIVGCTVVYEYTKLTKDKWVARLNRSLKAERDEIAAMKDNLDVGLFMMDRDFRIQPQYSRALERIVGEGDLAGRNFVDLLDSSIRQKEKETLMDYFTMVFNRSFDDQMLDDINPLHELTYVHGSSGEEKKLACSFTTVDRADGAVFVLASIVDRTREVALQTQLSEEEGKRQEEMRALFEVIHVEPRVLNDFIEDTEYEFDRVNAILKDNALSSREVMVNIYQSVHAIKSNAVILGLNSFAVKLHALEDEIKLLRERDDVAFDEVLHVTVELDKLMKIKDGFKGVIAKIASFSMGESRMQEEHVLVQTIERAVGKAAESLGKKATLVVRHIDPRAIERGPRRALKEILMQLARNAVYHGIESPQARAAAGKEECGCVALSVALDGDRVVVDLTDDGRGLDFTAIRAKAEAMNLIADPSQLDDKGALTQVLFAPGFSTAERADMYAGRGIGLNLVKERVKELKGTIKLSSEEGKGTTFRISVPAEAVAHAAVQTA